MLDKLAIQTIAKLTASSDQKPSSCKAKHCLSMITFSFAAIAFNVYLLENVFKIVCEQPQQL